MLCSINMQKIQLRIPYILGCANITKFDIYNSEQCKIWKPCNLLDFVIFLALNIKNSAEMHFWF
jgi:hypothetical protein